MKKPILIFTAVLGLVFTGCSSDDEGDRNCESCTAQGERIEICDNGDGTYTLSADGESEVVTEEDLGGISPEAFVDVICTLANDLGQ